jgi:tetratricopeptide (TPR) repeat protein
MKIICSTLITAVFLSFSSVIKADATGIEYQERLYQIYQSGEMTQWVGVLDQMKSLHKLNPNNDLLYDITLTQYGYIGYLLGIKDNRTARVYLAEADKNVEKLSASRPNDANVLALKGALMAYQIALSPYKAPFIGPRSMSVINESIELNPNAPQALLEKANSAHYAPSMFGGDPNLAVQFYSKAIAEFIKENGGNPPRNWIYLNAYAQMALAYEKAKQLQNAKRTYMQILTIAPDFKWVRDDLYPKFQINHPH